MKELEVIAGIIRFPFNTYLVGRRPYNKSFGGLLEFPGGQVEKGESQKECLYREIEREEFPGMRIKIHGLFGRSTYPDDKLKIRLSGYNADHVSGLPLIKNPPLWYNIESSNIVPARAHIEVYLLEPWQMNPNEFAPADRELVRKLQRKAA